MRGTGWTRGFVLFATAAIGAAAGQDPGRPEPASRSSAIVHVGVHALDGSPVAALSRDHFEVFVGGKPRPIESFSADAGPLTLVVLVDVTTSTIASPRDLDAADLLRDVTSLRPSDRVRAGRVSRDPALGAGFTNNRRELLREFQRLFGVDEAQRRGPSPIWDAAAEAITALETEPGQRGVVLVTDGRASGNRLSLDDVAGRAVSSGVAVSAVGTGAGRVMMIQSKTTAVNVTPGRLLQWVTEASGGVYLSQSPLQSGMRDRGRQLNRVVQALQHTYALSFAAFPEDNPTPVLEVRVRSPELRVRAPRAFLNPAYPRR
jgi:hypothetical protein